MGPTVEMRTIPSLLPPGVAGEKTSEFGAFFPLTPVEPVGIIPTSTMPGREVPDKTDPYRLVLPLAGLS
jgi:hypothetical protein